MPIPINLEDGKLSCGCPISKFGCGHTIAPFTVTRTELQRLDKATLFRLFKRTISDEMSPIMWRGFTKREIVDLFLTSGRSQNVLRRPAKIPDQVELNPFI
jgi:hypothetical protein